MAAPSAAPRPYVENEPTPPPSLRHHDVYVPEVAGSLPVVMLLHGYGLSAAEMAARMDLQAFAERHQLIMVVPDGTQDPTGKRFWNADPSCCDFYRRKPNDLLALRLVLDHVVKTRHVDRNRIYVAGYSNGAFMAERLACELDERIAAIAAISGSGVPPAECAARSPVAVLHIHGDADEIVPLEGGRVRMPIRMEPVTPVSAVVEGWAETNACGAVDQSTITFAGHTTDITRHHGCRAPAELWRLQGGPHVVATDAASIDRVLDWLKKRRRVAAD